MVAIMISCHNFTMFTLLLDFKDREEMRSLAIELHWVTMFMFVCMHHHVHSSEPFSILPPYWLVFIHVTNLKKSPAQGKFRQILDWPRRPHTFFWPPQTGFPVAPSGWPSCQTGQKVFQLQKLDGTQLSLVLPEDGKFQACGSEV